MTESTVQTIDINASPDECFAVAADIAAYPEWATGVRSTEVLETDDDGRVKRASFVIDGMVKELAYDLVYTYDGLTMRWSAEPGGDLDLMEGSYNFREAADGTTEVVYALRAEPGFTIPGFLRRQVEKQIVTTALRGLRQRVESLGG